MASKNPWSSALMNSIDQEINWREEIKLHAARMAWRKRRRPVPSGKYSWAIWWEKKFGEGETLNEYAERMRKLKDAD
jgi:hypothetical protein